MNGLTSVTSSKKTANLELGPSDPSFRNRGGLGAFSSVGERQEGGVLVHSLIVLADGSNLSVHPAVDDTLELGGPISGQGSFLTCPEQRIHRSALDLRSNKARLSFSKVSPR